LIVVVFRCGYIKGKRPSFEPSKGGRKREKKEKDPSITQNGGTKH